MDSSRTSVRLYSRDDVWAALKAQRAIIEWFAKGNVPHTAQAR